MNWKQTNRFDLVVWLICVAAMVTSAAGGRAIGVPALAVGMVAGRARLARSVPIVNQRVFPRRRNG
jgi:hypothetical protein